MRRATVFAGRCLRELLRDPLSYIFCLGFPVVMLGLMYVIDQAIPPEAGMTLFEMESLAPGIAVFGLSFVMLFAALSVSKDRSGAFFTRLLTSPMRARDFLLGYTMPLLAIALGQFAVTALAAETFVLFEGEWLPLFRLLLSMLVLLPQALFFIAAGVLFGTLLGEKSAPPCCSILISLCGIMGGIWFDLEALPQGGFFSTVCRILPFSHATRAARAAASGDYVNITLPFSVTLAWAAVTAAVAVLCFRRRMRGEN